MDSNVMQETLPYLLDAMITYRISATDIAEFCALFETNVQFCIEDYVYRYILFIKACNKLSGFLHYEAEYGGVLPKDYIEQSINSVFKTQQIKE